jgi:hypothetical protein
LAVRNINISSTTTNWDTRFKEPLISVIKKINVLANKANASSKVVFPYVHVDINILHSTPIVSNIGLKAPNIAAIYNTTNIKINSNRFNTQGRIFLPDVKTIAYLDITSQYIESEIIPILVDSNINTNINEPSVEVLILALMGSTIEIQAEFRDFSGKLVDPNIIEFKVYEKLNQLMYSQQIPQTNKVSTGIYKFNYTIPVGNGSLVYEVLGKIGDTVSLAAREKLTREWVR